ncbi:MAG TPA: DinB family protein [Terriglobales bacterium]|nr:DinB family protein [Terriglobales bacterium]
MPVTFASISSSLLETVRSAEPMLHEVGNADATFRAVPGKWSGKEILAHLIDSASNNHQRFVRAATQGNLQFPGYEQDKMVSLQNPNLASWELLIELWSAYNRYLAHVLQQIPDSSAEIACSIGGRPPVTLLWLAGDYVEHLRHHLNQIVGNRFQTAWNVAASF